MFKKYSLARIGVVGIVGLTVYAGIRAALNTQNLSADVISLINLIPLVLASGLVIGIVITAFVPRE